MQAAQAVSTKNPRLLVLQKSQYNAPVLECIGRLALFSIYTFLGKCAKP